WEAFALKGSAAAMLGLYDEGATALKKAVAAAPEDRRPRLQEALDRCERETQYRALTASGAARMEARQYEEAAGDYQRAASLLPARGAAGLSAALAWSLAGEKARALEILDPLRSSGDTAVAARARQMHARLSGLDAAGN